MARNSMFMNDGKTQYLSTFATLISRFLPRPTSGVNIARLQRTHNTAARLIMRSPRNVYFKTLVFVLLYTYIFLCVFNCNML